MNEQIREQIKEEMRQKGITQTKLGELTGIKQPNISYLLGGGGDVGDQWTRILSAMGMALTLEPVRYTHTEGEDKA